MNDTMRFLCLLMVTTWIQHSDGDSGSSEMLNPATTTSEPEESDKETTTEVSTHSLLISTTAQCLTDTEMGCPITANYNDSPTATTLCMNQTSTVEHTKTTMVTVSICRLTPSPCKVSHAVTSSCPACIPSRVITTIHHQLPPVVLQNTITTCPVCRPASTVTTTIYQQSPVVLSNTAGIGILAISAVLICLPIIAIVIVTYCWVRARRTLKKKRTDPEMKFVYLAQDSFPKSLSIHTNENTESAKEIDPPIPRREAKTGSPVTNLEAIITATPQPPRQPQNDNSLIHKDQIAEQAKNLKPLATIIEPSSPRRPSNGPIYDTPRTLKKRDDQDSETTIAGGSEKKSGEGVAVGVATTQDQRQVESEENIKQNDQKGKENKRSESKSEPQYAKPVLAAKGKESGGGASANKRKARENQYDKPIIPAKGKESGGEASSNKRKARENQYDKPVIASKGKEREGGASANKRKARENQYDKPVLAAKGKEREGGTSGNTRKARVNQYDKPVIAAKEKEREGQESTACKQKVCEHQYDKPVVAAKPKNLNSKKDKGGDSEGNEEHKYHVLEGPILSNENEQETKEDHEYHVLEGPAPREESKGIKPDRQEVGGNVYHVLEGPTPRDEKDIKQRDKQVEGGNVYHVLEGPATRDENSDRNPDRQDKVNVYHVLDGPAPKEEHHSKNPDEQKGENIYHVLEGPTPTED